MSAEEIMDYVTASIAWAVIWFAIGFSVAWVIRHENPRSAVARSALGITVLVILAWIVWSEHDRQECNRENFRSAFAGLADRFEAGAIEREADKIRWRSVKEILAQPIDRPLTVEEQNLNRQRWLTDLNEADLLIAEAEDKRAAAPNPYVGLRECR